MNCEELLIFIEVSIESLNKYDDNTDFILGYIKALEDIKENLKDR